jgi:hypothetical protein
MTRHQTRNTVVVRLSIPQDLMDWLSKIAAAHGLSVTRLINSAIVIATNQQHQLVTDAKDVEQEWPATRNG